MYRFLLTPRWWGINLFVVLAIPFCLFMGSWQLGRFEDRVDGHRAAERQPAVNEAKPAAPLEDLLPVDLRTSGQHATARGAYDRENQLVVPDRRVDERRGYYVLSLLRTEGGKALPVVRGWLPGDPGGRDVPAAPRGEVTVTGALQASENSGTDGVRTGGLPPGQLGMISAATLVNLVPYDVYDGWITLGPDQVASGMTAVPPVAPAGSGLDLKAFQNLGYTGEWFVFAGFVLFMWVRLVRREAEAVRDAALGLVPDGTEAPDGTGAQDGPDTGRQREQVRAGAAGQDPAGSTPVR